MTSGQAGPHISTVETAGFETHLVESGRGHAMRVLLLHGGGLGVDARANWLDTIEALGERFHCIAPDLVGFGATDHPHEHFDGASAWLELRVRQCVALLDALGVERAALIGNSAGGGAVALAMLREVPDRVERVVLLGGAGVRSGADDLSIAPTRALAFYDDPSPERMLRMLQPFSANPAQLPEPLSSIAARRFETAMRPQVRRSFESMWAAGGDGLELADEDLRAIDRPVLLLHGRDDTLADPARSLRLSRMLPDADLCVLSGAGHWLHLDRPAMFRALVTAFLLDHNTTREA